MKNRRVLRFPPCGTTCSVIEWLYSGKLRYIYDPIYGHGDAIYGVAGGLSARFRRCGGGRLQEGVKVRCPHCGSFDDKVIESRTLAGGEAIRRRRECNGCGYRFTSYERIDDKQQLMVIKRDGRREPFDRHKIERRLVKQYAAILMTISVERRNKKLSKSTRAVCLYLVLWRNLIRISPGTSNILT
jgi:DNA-directed RNA polymerase subunit RPC12/RpoP